jgi:hypothetical protein
MTLSFIVPQGAHSLRENSFLKFLSVCREVAFQHQVSYNIEHSATKYDDFAESPALSKGA